MLLRQLNKKDEHYKIIWIITRIIVFLRFKKRDHVISFNVAVETNLDQEKTQKEVKWINSCSKLN